MVRQNVFGAFTTYITTIAQPILSTARDPMNQGSWIFRTTPDEVSARHFSCRKFLWCDAQIITYVEKLRKRR